MTRTKHNRIRKNRNLVARDLARRLTPSAPAHMGTAWFRKALGIIPVKQLKDAATEIRSH